MPLMLRRILVVALVVWSTALSSPALAALFMDFGLEYSQGTTNMESGNIPWGMGMAYYLDGNDHPTLISPRTRIELPLNVTMAVIGAGFETKAWQVQAAVKTNLHDPSQKGEEEEFAVIFQDDAGAWWYQTLNGSVTPDVEARLDAELDAWVVDAKVRYAFYSYFPDPIEQNDWTKCYVGLGFEHQQFSYHCQTKSFTKASLIGEWSYSPNGPLWMDYDVVYTIPYLELALAGRYHHISTVLSFGYSPRTWATDSQTNYLGRIAGPFSADGDCKGTTILAGLQVGYEINRHWLAQIGFDYRKINTDGDQDVVCAAGTMATGIGPALSWPAESWSNDEEITSEQTAFGLQLAYRF